LRFECNILAVNFAAARSFTGGKCGSADEGKIMVHGVGASPDARPRGSSVEKVLPWLSALTMIMTLPQIWTIWVLRDASGVSLLSWGTYLLAACLWFVHGVQTRDKAIYVACVGWVLLDAAVVLGVLLYR
jgi:uncharacterized protein with PQ loop repeat